MFQWVSEHHGLHPLPVQRSSVPMFQWVSEPRAHCYAARSGSSVPMFQWVSELARLRDEMVIGSSVPMFEWASESVRCRCQSATRNNLSMLQWASEKDAYHILDAAKTTCPHSSGRQSACRCRTASGCCSCAASAGFRMPASQAARTISRNVSASAGISWRVGYG